MLDSHDQGRTPQSHQIELWFYMGKKGERLCEREIETDRETDRKCAKEKEEKEEKDK